MRPAQIIRVLKAERLEQGLFKTTLGRAAGLSNSTVGSIEDKGHMPTIDTLCSLAKVLGLELVLRKVKP